jgi:methylglutaconyl-CoA hydratase
MKLEEGGLSLEVNHKIATLSFFHPKSNSLPGRLLNKMAEAINSISEREDVTVLILRSQGEKAFCAGASFDELISIKDFPTGKEFFMGFARVINALRRCPKFVIGRIHGKAVGGGVGLAASVDYALATREASIKLSELAVGIGPFVVGPAVERKIGVAAFSTLSIDTEWRSADWAYSKGLYSELFENEQLLDEAIQKLSQKLAQSNPEAMAFLKETLWSGTEDWNTLLEKRAEMSGKLILSDFSTSAISKFKSGERN